MLDFLEKHNFKNLDYKREIIKNIMYVFSGRYNLCAKRLDEIMKKTKSIVDNNKGNFTIKEQNMIESYIETLQLRIIFSNSHIIRTLLELLNNADFDEYFNKELTNIKQLHDTILQINKLYPLSGFSQSDSNIETLINYFKSVKEVFNEEKFRYARDEIIYFLEKVTFQLDILKIWYGKEADLKEVQYYNHVTGEFDQSILENFDSLISGLDEFERYILDNPEDQKTVSAFIRILAKIEDLDRRSFDHSRKNENKIFIKLDNIYKQFQENPFILQNIDDSWKFCKIRLFRMQIRMRVL